MLMLSPSHRKSERLSTAVRACVRAATCSVAGVVEVHGEGVRLVVGLPRG